MWITTVPTTTSPMPPAASARQPLPEEHDRQQRHHDRAPSPGQSGTPATARRSDTPARASSSTSASRHALTATMPQAAGDSGVVASSQTPSGRNKTVVTSVPHQRNASFSSARRASRFQTACATAASSTSPSAAPLTRRPRGPPLRRQNARAPHTSPSMRDQEAEPRRRPTCTTDMQISSQQPDPILSPLSFLDTTTMHRERSVRGRPTGADGVEAVHEGRYSKSSEPGRGCAGAGC